MHFIPSILNVPLDDSEKKTVTEFIDNSQSFELKFSICDTATHKDLFFFSHGLSETDDIE